VANVPDIGGAKNPMCKNLYRALACFAWYEAYHEVEKGKRRGEREERGAFLKKTSSISSSSTSSTLRLKLLQFLLLLKDL
jgi:hypothetical protein